MIDAMTIPALIVLTASIIAGITDVWNFKVYNLLTFPLVAAGVGFNAYYGGRHGCMLSIYGLLVALGIFIIPYVLGAVGAGDVKYIAGIGAWMGFPAVFYVAIVGCLATGVYSVAVIIFHGRIRETWISLQIIWRRLLSIGHYLRNGEEFESVQMMARQPDRRCRLVPISAMMAIGVFATIIWHGLDHPELTAATSNEQRAASSEQRATSNEQRATSNEQRATRREQQ